jgi:hypothetical protein
LDDCDGTAFADVCELDCIAGVAVAKKDKASVAASKKSRKVLFKQIPRTKEVPRMDIESQVEKKVAGDRVENRSGSQQVGKVRTCKS